MVRCSYHHTLCVSMEVFRRPILFSREWIFISIVCDIIGTASFIIQIAGQSPYQVLLLDCGSLYDWRFVYGSSCLRQANFSDIQLSRAPWVLPIVHVAVLRDCIATRLEGRSDHNTSAVAANNRLLLISALAGNRCVINFSWRLDWADAWVVIVIVVVDMLCAGAYLWPSCLSTAATASSPTLVARVMLAWTVDRLR